MKSMHLILSVACLPIASAHAQSLPEPFFKIEEIKKVVLKVSADAGGPDHPTGGSLYRVTEKGTRKFVAQVDTNGKPDRPVNCFKLQTFEAEAHSPIDRAVDPFRVQCAGELKFSFRRSIRLVTAGATAAPWKGGFYASADAPYQVSAYSLYADKFSKQGHADAAATMSDAAIAAVAKSLGDSVLDTYVYRDAVAGYKLQFTEEGVVALRKSQLQAGLEGTGVLDLATRELFAKASKTDKVAQPPVFCGSAKKGVTCAVGMKPGGSWGVANAFELPAVN